MATDTHALAQIWIAGKDRRLPAFTLLTQHFTEFLIQVDQAGRLTEAFTIGRVAYHQALLALVGAG